LYQTGALPHTVSTNSIRHTARDGRWRVAATDEAAANRIVYDVDDDADAGLVVSDQDTSAHIVLE
jgi:hypothetical protein